MTRDEIKQTVDDFVSLVEKGCDSVEENEAKLKLLLDKLALAQHFADYNFDKTDYAEAQTEDYGGRRKLAAARFPHYGIYNVAVDVTKNVGEGKAIVGDSIDDIADITGDLIETKWRWEKNSPEDALCHFKFSFESHWSQHLRELQIYLLNLDRGT